MFLLKSILNMELIGMKLSRREIMKNKVSSVMTVSVFTNIFLAIAKMVTGFLFKSGALISDGIHSFSDLITDIFAIIGSTLAQKPADDKHPYGHGKIEYLTSLIIGIIIIIIGVEVIYNAFTREAIIPSIIVVIVSFVTIIAKLLLSNYIIHQGMKLNNNILIASGKESRTDVISSIIVLISTLFMQLGNYSRIFTYSDMIASVIVGLFILNVGYKVLKENVSIVLGEQETDRKYVAHIRHIIKKTPGVVSITSLVIMKFGPKSSLTLTILMDGNMSLMEAHKTADQIEDKIRKYSENIAYINIHIEPYQKLINSN